MLKNISQLEHIIEGKSYKFICDMDSNIPHILDALFQFMMYVKNIEAQMKANADAQLKDKQESVHVQVPEVSSPVSEEVKNEEIKAE